MKNLHFQSETILREQLKMSKALKSGFISSPLYAFIAIAKNFDPNTQPINGLRHPVEGQSSGWYIYSGEGFPQEIDAFDPIHIFHLIELCPEILKFLGLPPGWRFLKAGTYEDVWEDENLLKIEPSDPNDSIFPLFGI